MSGSDVDIVKVEVNVGGSPWMPKYEEFKFSRGKLVPIANELVDECAGRDYDVSYLYDRHVSKVLKKHWDSRCGSMRPFQLGLLVLLRELERPEEGWHGGAVAAIRCLETRLAYSTPGFIEAKLYSEVYGS